jgi:hypothetical protein
MGEGEIDFESFWNLNGMTGVAGPNIPTATARLGEGTTSRVGMPQFIPLNSGNIQGISDSSIPLFGMSNVRHV